LVGVLVATLLWGVPIAAPSDASREGWRQFARNTGELQLAFEAPIPDRVGEAPPDASPDVAVSNLYLFSLGYEQWGPNVLTGATGLPRSWIRLIAFRPPWSGSDDEFEDLVKKDRLRLHKDFELANPARCAWRAFSGVRGVLCEETAVQFQRLADGRLSSRQGGFTFYAPVKESSYVLQLLVVSEPQYATPRKIEELRATTTRVLDTLRVKYVGGNNTR
jgi:hypothetical protein